MQSYTISPRGNFSSYGSFSEDVEKGASGEDNLHLDESNYARPWFFIRWFNTPFYFYQYLRILVMTTSADCILGRNRITSDSDAPAYSRNKSYNLMTSEENDEVSLSTVAAPDRIWNLDSAALCIMLPGLNASPTMFTDLCRKIQSVNSNVDFYTPDLMELGIGNTNHGECLEECQSRLIMETVRHYLRYATGSSNDVSIVLLAFSKGTQVQAFLDEMIRNEFPRIRVLFIAIGGIFDGTKFVQMLQTFGLGSSVGDSLAISSMSYKSEVSKRVHKALSGASLASHSYEFIASRADEYVWPFTSSLPVLPILCRHHVFMTTTHNALFGKSYGLVIELISQFLKTFH